MNYFHLSSKSFRKEPEGHTGNINQIKLTSMHTRTFGVVTVHTGSGALFFLRDFMKFGRNVIL